MKKIKDYKSVLRQSWQLRRDKRFPEAELVLHEALADYSDGGFEHNLLKANLADVLLRQGNRAAARKLALEVLEKQPSQVTALMVLGLAALEEKVTAEAVENLAKAYRLAPSPYRAGRLARALELDGRIEQALAVLQEALQENPGDSYLRQQYGTLKEKAAAAAASDPAATESPRAAEAAEEDFLAYAAQMKEKLKGLEPAEAAAQLQKIIKVGRRKANPHLHLLLGDLRRKAGDETGAAAAYAQAWELDPENLLALSQLLFSYRRLGRKEEAWPLLKRLLYHRPGDKTAKASLIRDALDLGKEEEAVLFFEELLQRYPHHKEFYGAIRKLKAKEA
ncbi:MAG: tetratricopeptide repeat protein [Firmicutes bacterium]|nr:tetratricopeptide repeat protein [Bacillota bacterium]